MAASNHNQVVSWDNAIEMENDEAVGPPPPISPQRKNVSETYNFSSPSRSGTTRHRTSMLFETEAETSNEFNVVEKAENEVEAKKIYNNYRFGLRKWKSHVSSRSIDSRSEIVQSLFSDISSYTPVRVSTFRISNILYFLLVGWWLALLYSVIGVVMCFSVLGFKHGKMCFRLARYFLWPFGKFVYQSVFIKPSMIREESETDGLGAVPACDHSEVTPVLPGRREGENDLLFAWSLSFCRTKNHPGTYLWFLVGLPVLWVVHAVLFAVSWFFVVTIPIAKINIKTMTRVLFMPADEVRVGDSGVGLKEGGLRRNKIIMYTHQAFNVYYYKYTVDGVNVIVANLLLFVILSIAIGYADSKNELTSPIMKCILSILSILPVTYYIGMAITSISAVSNFAVGAFLNATFGSMVEVLLFIMMLKKGRDDNETCFVELVKSTLTGSILCCILLVPGLSMVIGGLKFRRQNFNPKSANISSSLLFVAVIGVFAPTIFSKIYGNLECDSCEPHSEVNGTIKNGTGFLCSGCRTVTVGPDNNQSLYKAHVEPLVYTCSLILPIAYIIGLIFSMKTHTAEIFDDFENRQRDEGAGSHGGRAQWSRVKSTFILLLCATAIALSSDLISANIPPLLNASGISEYFIGVTLLSIVSMLAEIVNGIQFSLQNNVNLAIEIGSAAAIQVCMVQLPIIVLANLIYPMGFNAVFSDIHLWAIVFAVIVINYIFQDGKSDYFQGSIVVFIYILLMAMYFFTVTPEQAVCKSQ
ncbi:low affinity vacuolar monovalent cation/H(+) antiporter-like [Aplysia californica]|uniref:Low affinity vacuolar monovalent cation/H(+) antiporter-like n=1 Tax=Aplysia californica TaxID=6500 RepID=A0ABM1VWM6_APLCA|nr:low affinity vacuolar monovalent cation/H(+) antiporter-like [Aplysia californica]